MKTKSLIALAGVLTLPCVEMASAHPGHGAAGGFVAGVAHPFSGLDHVLAMITVGWCAARIGGRALWLLPLTFLSFMIAGGWCAMGGHAVSSPMVEQGIAASVLILGLMLAVGTRLATPVAVLLIGVFAMFHGYAHGAEMHAGLVPEEYGAGFVVATGILLSIGLGIGIAVKRSAAARFTPFAGAAIALSGLLLFVW